MFSYLEVGNPHATHGSILDVLKCAENGSLIDFPALRPHQRVPVVTFLAVLLHLLRRYVPDMSEPSLRAALGNHFDAFDRLYGRLGEPAFLQSAVIGAKSSNVEHIERLDVPFVNLGHETHINTNGVPTHESGLFALISGQDRLFVLQYPAGARWGALAVLPSDGRTIGSEIVALADAYDSLSPDINSVSGQEWKAGLCLADHMPWLTHVFNCQDKSLSLTHKAMAWPVFDTLKIARMTVRNNEPLAVLIPGAPFVVKNMVMLDPHIAHDGVNSPVRLVKRALDFRIMHAMLFGRKASPAGGRAIRPAYIVSPRLRPHRLGYLRFAGIAYDQGKTLGFHEMLVRVSDVPSGDVPQEAVGAFVDYANKLSSEVIDAASPVLRAANATLMSFSAVPDITIGKIKSAIVSDTVPWVFRALDVARQRFSREIGEGDFSKLEPTLDEARELRFLVVDAALRIMSEEFRFLADSHMSLVGIARSYITFIGAIRAANKKYGFTLDEYVTMTEIGKEDQLRARSRFVYLIDELARLIGGENSNNAKRLRSMLADNPDFVVWRILGGLPLSQEEIMQPFWIPLMIGMANVRHRRATKRSLTFGAAMAEAGVTENRANSFLNARGEALVQSAFQVISIIRSRVRSNIDWTDVGFMMQADSNGDDDSLRYARTRIAIEYARYPRKSISH